MIEAYITCVAILIVAAVLFVAASHYWLDIRKQRHRALAELRTARRLRLLSEKSFREVEEQRIVLANTAKELRSAWHKMYGPSTAFPDKIEDALKPNKKAKLN